MDKNTTAPVKRGRGRPRKEENKTLVVSTEIKRKRGRPPKEKTEEQVVIKRPRGRPRKYTVVDKATGSARIKQVDAEYLTKHLLNYFTKLVVIHHKLSEIKGPNQVIFDRIKVLDIQMSDVCRALLGNAPTTKLEETCIK